MARRKKLSRKLAKRLEALGGWIAARSAHALLSLLRLLKPEHALKLADRVGRTFGPLISRHSIVESNLRAAFPHMDERERTRLAKASWGHTAQLMVEYTLLDRLWDHRWEDGHGERIEVVGAENLARLRDSDRSSICFTGHIGNFEFLPVVASSFGIDMTALVRPPNNRWLATMLEEARRPYSSLVSNTAGAARQLVRSLRDGRLVGVLVDQKFFDGVLVDFFGRPATVNPLSGRLASQFDAQLVPALCLRVAPGRYRIQIFEPIEPPRKDDGRIDEDAVALLTTRIVESWVADTPEQWMWMHDRWGNKRNRARPLTLGVDARRIDAIVVATKLQKAASVSS